MTKIEGIYLIGEPENLKSLEDFFQTLDKVLKSGIKIFQLRIKQEVDDHLHLQILKEVRKITRARDCLFMVNDRPDLTVLAEADGLHLGPKDLPVEEARKIIGRKILGVSNHSLQDVIKNRDKDIDYFSIGPIYATTSKKIPDPVVGVSLLERCLPMLSPKPVVAIGGISIRELPIVLETGVSCIGVISGILSAERPDLAAEQYLKIFKEKRDSGRRI